MSAGAHDAFPGGPPDREAADQEPRSWTPERELPVPVVVGTRPEAIKLVPVILALRESRYYKPIVVSTFREHLHRNLGQR